MPCFEPAKTLAFALSSVKLRGGKTAPETKLSHALGMCQQEAPDLELLCLTSKVYLQWPSPKPDTLATALKGHQQAQIRRQC